MNLPDKFEVALNNKTEAMYVVTKIRDGEYEWRHIRTKNSHFYSENETKDLMKRGYQIINQPATNGVDANGTPIYFDKTMLKQFDRVVTKAEGTWIVTGSKIDDEFCLENGSGFIHFYNDEEQSLGNPEYIAMEVYSCSRQHSLLNKYSLGELRWKRQAIPVEDTPTQKQKKELLAAAETAKQALAEITKKLNELEG